MNVGGSNRRGSGGSHPARNGRATAHSSSGDLAFTFPSNYEQGHTAQKRILDAIEQHGFRGESFFALRIALEEALVNAIKHGNRLDPQKNVHVEVSVTANRAEIRVEDEGAGFDRSSVPDPTVEENLEKCSGRGILLIEAYMSKVHWDRGGRRLIMVRENAGE